MSQIHEHLQEASSSATPDTKSYLQKQNIVLYIERKNIGHLTQGQTCQLSIQTQSRNGYGFQTDSGLSTFLKYDSRNVWQEHSSSTPPNL